jgi:hypothetical protein
MKFPLVYNERRDGELVSFKGEAALLRERVLIGDDVWRCGLALGVYED